MPSFFYEEMAMNGMSGTRRAADKDLWANEEYAIEQYESGKDRPKPFKTAADLIRDLHGTATED